MDYTPCSGKDKVVGILYAGEMRSLLDMLDSTRSYLKNGNADVETDKNVCSTV